MPITINLHMHTDEPSDVSDFLEYLRAAEMLDQCTWSVESHPADDDADRTQAILQAALKARDEYIEKDQTPPHGTERPVTQSMFRGLLADFNGACHQIADLHNRVTVLEHAALDEEPNEDQRPVVHYRYTSEGKTRMHGTDLNCLTTGFHEWVLTSGSAKLRTHQCSRCGLIRHEVAAGL